MSLNHIRSRRDPTVFGADLNVLLGDITINGDLDVNGLINGKSAQGQNTNNVWTGTNEFSVNRPQTAATTGVGFSGVSVAQQEANAITDSIINQGATWTGTNDFTQEITYQGALVFPTPVAGTDGVTSSFVTEAGNAKDVSYLSATQTWTNTNTFSILPLCDDPASGTEIATKNYVDTTTAAVVIGRAVTSVGQDIIQNAVYNDTLAMSVQVIGGGGGSTPGTSNDTPGYAGGAGGSATLLVLNKAIGGAPLGSWTLVSGVGGNGGTGVTAPEAYSTPGAISQLSCGPLNGTDLAPFAPANCIEGNGGQGNQGFAGDTSYGPSIGGQYTNTLFPTVTQPLASANGENGGLGGGRSRQSSGINNFGWGAPANVGPGNGSNGQFGGYGLTRYIG